MEPVTIAFVRATATSITLDFSVGAQAAAAPAGALSYELQWQLFAEPGEEIGAAPADEAIEWKIASSTLKNSRCTKSGLTPGATYVFRARTRSDGIWGPLGSMTAPLRTLLPELPENCSESLKVPSKVLAAQAEKEAKKAQSEASARAAREKAAAEEKAMQQQAMQIVHKAEDAVRAYQHKASRTIGQALEEFSQHAQRTLLERAEKRVVAVRADLQEEVKNAEFAVLDEVLSTVRVAEIGVGIGADGSASSEEQHASTMIKIETAKAKVYKQFHGALETRLASACAAALSDVESDVDSLLLQHLRSARREVEAAAPTELGAGTEGDVQARHAVERGLLAAVQHARLEHARRLEQAEIHTAAVFSLAGAAHSSSGWSEFTAKPLDALMRNGAAAASGGEAPGEGAPDGGSVAPPGVITVELPTRLDADAKLSDSLKPHGRRLRQAIARALEATEARALQRQQSALAEAWLLCEALRSQDHVAMRRDAALAQHHEHVAHKRSKNVQIQKLFEHENFSEETKVTLTAEAAMAAECAAARLAEVASIDAACDASRAIWMADNDAAPAVSGGTTGSAAAEEAKTAKEAAAAILPPQKLSSLLALTGAFEEELLLTSAIERAVEASRAIAIHRVNADERGGLLRKALETVIKEAVHWTQLKVDKKTGDERLLLPLGSADAAGGAASGALVKHGGGGAMHITVAGLESPRHADAARAVVDAITAVVACAKQLDVGDDDAKSYASASTLMEDERTWRAALERATAQIGAAYMAQHEAEMLTARQLWAESRDADRLAELERHQQALAKTLQHSKLEAERSKAEAVEEATRHVRSLREVEMRAAVEEGVRHAVAETQERCDKVLQQEVSRAAQEAFDTGKASIGRSASQAMLAAAQHSARDLARKEVEQDLARASAAEAAARSECEQLRQAIGIVKEDAQQAARDAVARAVPLQRGAHQAHVEEAVAAERARLEKAAQQALQAERERWRTEAASHAEALRTTLREQAEVAASASAKAMLVAAKEEARREERIAQRSVARGELREALEAEKVKAAAEKTLAVQQALVAEERRRAAAVSKGAVTAVLEQSATTARSIEATAAAQLRRSLEQAEIRHRINQKQAVQEAVSEALSRRKKTEEQAVAAAVTAAREAANQQHLAEQQAAVRAAQEDTKGACELARQNELAAVRAEAEKEARLLIKPQLQKQEAVEQAIRDAEERARDRERQLAVQVTSRIEEMAMTVAEQPKAVQEAIRKAVRESEDRADSRLKTVHDAYERAAAEQQLQVKELLREAAARAKAQQQAAVASAVGEAEAAAAEERRLTLEHARQAVQMSASQTAEQMDGVLVELAELRGENLRLAAELEAARELSEEAEIFTSASAVGGGGVDAESSGPATVLVGAAADADAADAGGDEAIRFTAASVSLDVEEEEDEENGRSPDGGGSEVSGVSGASSKMSRRVLEFD